ncbi:helix-turn-helix transcriptional regulator [Limibaculum sp. FT325]|uniref:helix-turn-helix transcriptional regulator n=1 Tax=Thermohalobaculum sediminis TaxID=2939436 RepID=UPI0020BE5644|nr:helix-turn-helix transcriptional regulator [Limibaculum sediminis]MCL5776177.1 helix-turn-helix transcriptional regulator [Limibaculum sediminis]
MIERNIASARLDAARIAKLAGVSRTTLYRIFEGSAGVAAHVRMIRLEGVRTALRDPGQAKVPIAAIAERHGFHSIASFNRAFRRAFGITPGKARAATHASTPVAAGAMPPVSVVTDGPEAIART